jgi:endonuclease/exonuclease/phosphatase family metal-dependent hydrolase
MKLLFTLLICLANSQLLSRPTPPCHSFTNCPSSLISELRATSTFNVSQPQFEEQIKSLLTPYFAQAKLRFLASTQLYPSPSYQIPKSALPSRLLSALELSGGAYFQCLREPHVARLEIESSEGQGLLHQLVVRWDFVNCSSPNSPVLALPLAPRLVSHSARCATSSCAHSDSRSSSQAHASKEQMISSKNVSDLAPALPLKVMTYNVLNFNDGLQWDAHRVRDVASVIRAQSPDLVGLQELRHVFPSGVDEIGKNALDDLRALLPDYPYFHFQPAQINADFEEGLGVLSRLPLLSTSYHPLSLLPSDQDQNHRIVLQATVDAPAFASRHPSGPLSSALQFFVTHLSYRPDNDEQSRQIAEVLLYVNSSLFWTSVASGFEPDGITPRLDFFRPPQVLLGDLNVYVGNEAPWDVVVGRASFELSVDGVVVPVRGDFTEVLQLSPTFNSWNATAVNRCDRIYVRGADPVLPVFPDRLACSLRAQVQAGGQEAWLAGYASFGGQDLNQQCWKQVQPLAPEAFCASDHLAVTAALLLSCPLLCLEPAQPGFMFGAGERAVGSVRMATCDANLGFVGNGSTVTCQDGGMWSQAHGCSAACAEPASQPGYVVAPGASHPGAFRNVTCARGYMGSAEGVRCTDGIWSLAAGCELIDCGPLLLPVGYMINDSHTLGGNGTWLNDTRLLACDSVTGCGLWPGLDTEDRKLRVVCTADGKWTEPSGSRSVCVCVCVCVCVFVYVCMSLVCKFLWRCAYRSER